MTKRDHASDTFTASLDLLCREFIDAGLPAEEVRAALAARLDALGGRPPRTVPLIQEGERYHVERGPDGRDVYTKIGEGDDAAVN